MKPSQLSEPAALDAALAEQLRISARVADIVRRKRAAYTRPWFNAGYLHRIHELERAVLKALRSRRMIDLENRRVLDLGCGTGHWLREFAKWGASPPNLYGIDLIKERLAVASRLCPPATNLLSGDAARMTFPDHHFDLVLIFGVFCLIFEPALKLALASEAMRVLKPGGLILWCDYRYQPPGEQQLRIVRRAELAQLFAGARLELTSIHPLPPLIRKLAPYSRFACDLLAVIPPLRTHYFAVISHP